jgi:acetyl-CoA carboxylase biotin carboxyl carrier protein
VGLTDADVREILRIIDTSPLAEIRVRTNGFELHVVKDGTPERAAPGPAEPAPAPAPALRKPARASDLRTIAAPMLGLFYAADGPGEPPFVEPGARVEPDTTVCIIEVMKMMNSVPAGLSGTIVEVCAENAQLVEEGAPLFRVAPA